MRTLFCGVPCTVVVLVVYRNGGVDWLRSLGAAWFPGLFGWFIWRDEEVQPLARWLALVTAVLQVMGVVAALVLAAVGPATLQRLAVKADLQDPPAEPAKAPPPATEEDLQTLGLRPPCAISSIPPGARVLVDGKERGVTPLETRLAAGAKNRVRLELAGYFSEERVLEPNANERSALELELRRGGRVVVTSTPPGARVSLTTAPPEGDPMVLAKTPGPTATLEPGPTELLIALEGYEPVVKLVEVVKEDTPLEVTLSPGAPYPIDSIPPGAEVRLDGMRVGITPLQLFVSPDKKHTIEVTKEGWSTAKQTITRLKPDAQLSVTLTNLTIAPLKKELLRARAAYDKANLALEKLQAKLERRATPELERKLSTAEKDMERAATRLENVETKLREAEEALRQP